jgi:hypothetical protein
MDTSGHSTRNTELSANPTISDLTDQTGDTRSHSLQCGTGNLPDEMEEEGPEEEEDEEGLEPDSLMATPKSIPTFQPNKQWLKDVDEGLTKTRYGIEFKIEPQCDVSRGQTPEYNHTRIFKALVSAILSAAPTTVICSVNDEAEAFNNIDDINFTKQEYFCCCLFVLASSLFVYFSFMYVVLLELSFYCCMQLLYFAHPIFTSKSVIFLVRYL